MSGLMEWFTRNGVAANLVMFVVIVGGIFAIPSLNLEMFPKMTPDTIRVNLSYPGATPSEAEEGLVMRVEEAIQGLQGIKEIDSMAWEGGGRVSVEAADGFDLNRLKEDIKGRVDAISSFPADAERPTVEEQIWTRDVLEIAVYGDMDEKSLRRVAEKVRDDLLRTPGISQIEFQGARDYEIAIEIDEETLRKYGLTLEQVAARVNAASRDVPGGSVKATSGELLLRTLGQAYRHDDFADITLLTREDGTSIKLGQIATIRDGFTDDDIISYFNGHPAIFVEVFEVGNESPLDIASKTRAYIENQKDQFPPGVHLEIFSDSSFYLNARLSMMLTNGMLGLLLVMCVLTLFLRPALAFYVALGIPVSFLGTLMVAPWVDLSINMVSLFAFILVLGIVVDDAIVVGESVFTEYQHRKPKDKEGRIVAAIHGSHRVSVPIIFAVLTTMVAFAPVFFLPGPAGDRFRPIPYVVILTLAFSLIQSKLVLPYHLSTLKVGTGDRKKLGLLTRIQRKVADSLEHFVTRFYQPVLSFCLRHRYATCAAFIGVLLITIGLVRGGHMRYQPFPRVQSDTINVSLEYPDGTALPTTIAGLNQLMDSWEKVVDDVMAEGHADPVKNIAMNSRYNVSQGRIQIELTKSEDRDITTQEMVNRWRQKLGPMPGVQTLSMSGEIGGGSSRPINVQLVGEDFEEMEVAAQEIKDMLATLPDLYDISDSFTSGRREIKLSLKPRGEVLGITTNDLGRQVRQAFYGAEAQRILRGRDEVKVMVRYPRADRESLAALHNLRIRLADGSEVPFDEVAEADIGHGFSSITRIDRQRVINVTSDVDKTSANMTTLNAQIENNVRGILAKYPGVSSSLEGEAKDTRESNQALQMGFYFVLFLIYVLLAIPFKSYFQPLIVMSAIPFGIVGAIWGHFVTGTWGASGYTPQPITQMSIMGIIAAIGVVVNDSLVLVDYVNDERRQGKDVVQAAHDAGGQRFRPILLTSLTTFFGLVPMLLERSLQAQFLIPMATSLAFGVLFATFITLLLVPGLYVILEDCKWATKNSVRWLRGKPLMPVPRRDLNQEPVVMT
ncbi:MAG: efflux RND transporter permease subunit [Verrucomicrobiota bacterium JB022]|nr:efflux RND transporter permease subunit [Verrucomicrobiota bacterium JB022]